MTNFMLTLLGISGKIRAQCPVSRQNEQALVLVTVTGLEPTTT